ncbi:hypothetical protein R1flu_023053 [Riccia fluitans]|uniref:Small ribosomal subunit protein uS17 N-terminal domain-containing protein n=1 Tax=Riccia fluitans TaxID=41844 RepID=A0ABD1XR18_9MARC
MRATPFLKQPKVFLSSKLAKKGKAPGKAGTRFWKNIGLGFKARKEINRKKSNLKLELPDNEEQSHCSSNESSGQHSRDDG